MKKVLKRHILEHKGYTLTGGEPFPPSATSQQEPSLYDLLVRYQNGLDISSYVTTTAVKATAQQQFTNRIGKVDFLTEIPEYIKSVQREENFTPPVLNEKGEPIENAVNDDSKKVENVQTNVQNEQP